MIIGIGGVSRSGKSTLANLLVTYFRKNGKKAIIFHQDDFVFPETQIPKIKNKTNAIGKFRRRHSLFVGYRRRAARRKPLILNCTEK